MSQPTFTLATVAMEDGHTVPRARTAIFRGMFASIPPNSKNPAERNPPAFESDCPTFTTDARMEKAGQIAQNDRVEMVFWCQEPVTQWRVRGGATLLRGAESEEEWARERMRCVDEGKQGEWNVGREVRAYFGNMAPGMRGK